MSYRRRFIQVSTATIAFFKSLIQGVVTGQYSDAVPSAKIAAPQSIADYYAKSHEVFGDKFPGLDSKAMGQWWNKSKKGRTIDLNVPRDQVVAFALYTVSDSTLKLTAQLFPLMPDEEKIATLEFLRDGKWQPAASSDVIYPGWSVHFRIDDWDSSETVPYRVRHGAAAIFEGTVRADPVDKDEIVVATMSCNSSRTKGPREQIVDNLLECDPDLLFFGGDQTYLHTEHTAGFLEFGLQFRDVIKDRPTITIPDDHDVGQANLWGESGKLALNKQGPDGGYFYPPAYVNMVQRQQTWHLPDPADSTPIQRGISVYYTSLRLGGLGFAILEDRKFKSGPEGKIPQMGPRPDHINDPNYDRSAIDLDGLELLGQRQLRFLEEWSKDWTNTDLKVVLSQTAFCGAVHIHGSLDNRLLADLDCNGWPQSGRNEALRAIRKTRAIHLCGDQHLAVVVKHGIDAYGDGPVGFTNPALVNTIYGRWWHPKDEQPGPNARQVDGLPWLGDYEDGLGNKISMMAYANPIDISDETKRADGFGLVRFNKSDRTAKLECWPRFAKVTDGESGQFLGWPMTVELDNNDGRQPIGFLPKFDWQKELVRYENDSSKRLPVVAVVDANSQELVYCIRVPSNDYALPIFEASQYEIWIGANQPNHLIASAVTADSPESRTHSPHSKPI